MSVFLLDGKDMTSREVAFRKIQEVMKFPEYFGQNLDALYDILTGLPHRGRRFVLLLPEEDAPAEVRLYAERIRRVFQDSEEEIGE
jgi:ribonuclease inhibitor